MHFKKHFAYISLFIPDNNHGRQQYYPDNPHLRRSTWDKDKNTKRFKVSRLCRTRRQTQALRFKSLFLSLSCPHQHGTREAPKLRAMAVLRKPKRPGVWTESLRQLGMESWAPEAVVRSVVSSGDQMKAQEEKAASAHRVNRSRQSRDRSAQVQSRTRHFMRTRCSLCGQEAHAVQTRWEEPPPPPVGHGGATKKGTTKSRRDSSAFHHKTKCFLPLGSVDSGYQDQFTRRK